MSKNQDGLQFLAVLGQFNGFLAVKMTVLQFLSSQRFPKNLFKKYDLRSQIITKLKIEVMKNCPLRNDLLWNNDNDNCPV